MNRNVESRFAYNPTNIDIRRSRFDRNSSHKTSFNVGRLIPFYYDDVLPGDSFDIVTSKVVRLQTLLTPMMDNIFLDTYWFFVPNRLVWEHWKEFNGENTASAWIPQAEYTVPQVTAPESGWSIGTIADYFGVPTGVGGLSINALPFRAYALIVNEWFRDQNLLDPVNIGVGDTTLAGSNGDNYITDLCKGGKPFVCAKYHDYFTSALPAPQKGPDTILPLAGFADVVQGLPHPNNVFRPGQDSGLLLRSTADDTAYGFLGYSRNASQSTSDTSRVNVKRIDVDDTFPVGWIPDSANFVTDNLYADLRGVTMFSINQLRLAFQIQKLYEKDARGGTRYIEILKSHFGVTSPDYRLQRPEYLGGNRIPINVNQIIQQSESTDGSPLGNTAAYSVTSDVHSDVHKSFTEHGMIIGLCVARYDHTYQQGLEKCWSRKTRFDYYWPVFANIGEQPILNKEIFAQGTSTDDQVFGYQEAWADYRYKPSRVSGEMRSSATTSLDVWHLADDYASLPSLSSSWIKEDPSNVDRVLAVTSSVSNQLFMDVYVKNRTTRPMPLYSVPGLIDHH